ncbi:gamma carbonic anhydrase family protein [Gilliamella intestini]|uniref:Carbonic anhydrase or acetyltransferase, isoleucine patch superfamily n=1 Tax=Gilliamella intestini TaxID=1798183 RepID=A0A1C4A909_9GAMM|nr:gamma carbonic anhydrase family protein [Gilliamella intestini]SCB90963.1 Carbonic anhydrase or acetyltransferase, isoleucine patch superfamily [Gilliamella intestini]
MIYQLDNLHPKIDTNCFIAKSADIIGDVTLAKGVSIWFNAVLRGDIAPIHIGKNSNVQDNTTIHIETDIPCIVGENVTIGHNVILHSCTIEDNVLIGMGSTVLNNAKIAKNCLVGANSLVTHTIPYEEGCLIMGSPAKVIRKLTKAEITANITNAQRYVQNGIRFKTTLLPVA